MPRKKTTKEFIVDAKAKHGEEFDYSKVVYSGSKKKVIIICKTHGEFLIRPNDHLMGIKCPKCSGNYSMTSEEFIQQAKNAQGNKYDYTKTVYKNSKTKVIIICPIHGEFKQLPQRHLSSDTGCPQCSATKRGINSRIPKGEFLFRSKVMHNGRYLYYNVEYIKQDIAVEILCRVHGAFRQTPENHMNGSGCPLCAYIKNGRNKKLSLEEFIRRSIEAHNNFYIYQNTIYTGYDNKVLITCPIHGDFKQTAAHHMKGHGCPKCKGEANKLRLSFTTDDFIQLSKTKHGDRYNYSKVKYSTNRDKVCIICPEHGEFWQNAGLHMSGGNCSKCTGTFMDQDMFLDKALKVHKETYIYTKTVYKNTETPVIIICREHGEFLQSPHGHLQGQGCPVCASSIGELTIYNNLKRCGIIFETQKKFSECRYTKVLPFDFYIPKLDLLIEYHGRQHYEYIEFFHKTPEGFLFRQAKDKIKKEYAEKHHKFLAIPYWDFNNIEQILTQTIQKLDKELEESKQKTKEGEIT